MFIWATMLDLKVNFPKIAWPHMNVDIRIVQSNPLHGPFIQQPAAEGVYQHHGIQQGQAGQHPANHTNHLQL